MNILRKSFRQTDFVLLFLCLAATVFGLIVVYSATGSYNGISRDFRTMALAAAIGLVAAIVISFIDYALIIKLWPAIAGVCLLLMVMTYFFGVGPSARSDAKTWLKLGSSGLYFQASELVKIGFIITFGMHLDIVKDRINNIKTLALLVVHAMVPAGLVVITGDWGSALVFLVIFIAMMFMGGLKLRWFAAGAAAVAAAFPVVWNFLFSSIQKERFMALFNPEEYPDVIYQQQMGLTAIGAGKFSGMGLFNGVYTAAGLVPESRNDMIFTVIGEELGFIGCIAAIALIVLISVRSVAVGRDSDDNAASLMCCGFAAMIFGQMVINIGMCLMLLPVVGITLPFFSAGGSSNVCLYLGVGLVLSVFRHTQHTDRRGSSLKSVGFTE
ncbi:MAG: FtsW/RodA/SpoVE family cell cycle protein [Clostridia bacterium]|nr:FtsW/RodA/SpoVE family cell cycle protein [Clostridia bacterium]